MNMFQLNQAGSMARALAKAPAVTYSRSAVSPELAALRLLAYCRNNEWSGYDPYDALNSEVFKALPVLDAWFPRLALTQLLKRMPLNFRPLLLVPKTQNPKGVALFMSALLKLSRLGLLEQPELIGFMAERIVALRSQGTPYWCWGYSFPWQTRTQVVPRWAPNLVCTTFVASALLDAYEESHEARYLEMAHSASDFILTHLYRDEGASRAYLMYPLSVSEHPIHNANFLGAALLCRVARHTGERKFIEPALKVARYSAAKQHEDGSWAYGEGDTQGWIDNFHTGYNLCALRAIGRDLQTGEFESRIRRGFDFYRAHFFREDGAPRYFHNSTHPIDIHCVAQSIITLIAFRDLEGENVRLAHAVCRWTLSHMWDDRGFFYYRVLRLGTIKTSYMRWSQAWMLLALSTLLDESSAALAPLEDRKFLSGKTLHQSGIPASS